jgi:hypothetical protein
MPDNDLHSPASTGAGEPDGQKTLASSDLNATVEGEVATMELDMPETLPEWAVSKASRLGLVLDGVEFGRPGIYFDVYAGLPPGTEPNPDSLYYLGTLSSFGPGGDGTQVSYDVTELVKTLQAEGRWDGGVELTFVRRGLKPPDDQPDLETLPKDLGSVRISRVQLIRY